MPRDSEEERWNLIRKYKADVIMRIPMYSMRPGAKDYDAVHEQIFHEQWQRYKEER